MVPRSLALRPCLRIPAGLVACTYGASKSVDTQETKHLLRSNAGFLWESNSNLIIINLITSLITGKLSDYSKLLRITGFVPNLVSFCQLNNK